MEPISPTTSAELDRSEAFQERCIVPVALGAEKSAVATSSTAPTGIKTAETRRASGPSRRRMR